MVDGDTAAERSGLAATLQSRLNRLFDVLRPPHAPDREWRNTEVIEACRAAGRDLSASHLSELRRGIKTNPSVRVLDALAWFFKLRAGYFTEDHPDDVLEQLALRESELAATLDRQRRDQEDLTDAARELSQAMKRSGVTNMAHRGAATGEKARARAAQMRALAKLILEDDEEDD
jgi:transcriptional regulator with XRE-family HTH domain